MMFILDLLEST